MTNTPPVTDSYTASYTADPSQLAGSSPSRTPLPSESKITSITASSSVSPTLGSSPSVTQTNNIDFIIINRSSESPQSLTIGNIALGAVIGVVATLIILGGYYVIHKKNMTKTKPHSMRNIVYFGEHPQNITQNPAIGGAAAAAAAAASEDLSARHIDNFGGLRTTKKNFEPTGIRL